MSYKYGHVISSISFVSCLLSTSLFLIAERAPAQQQKLNTTTVTSDKFVEGGKLITTSDAKLKIHSEMWTDKNGKPIEIHEIEYDERGNVKTETWEIETVVCHRSGHPENNWDGKSYYFECGGSSGSPTPHTLGYIARTIDELEQELTKRIKDRSTPDTPSGKTPKTETPSTPDPKKTKGDSSLPEPPSSATVVDAKVPGYSATITTPAGLNTVVMTAPSKDVLEVYLPRVVVAGETFTGSIKIKTSHRHLISDSDFAKLTLKIGDQTVSLQDGLFTVKLGQESLNHLRLFDDQGQPLTGVDFSTRPAAPPPTEINIPTSSMFGQLLEITAPCTGTLGAGDFIKIGGKDMPVIAASNGTVVVRNDYDQAGLTEIDTKLCGVTAKKSLRVLTLNLSADSLNLLKGQSTTVHIVVGGLEKLRAPAHMKIVVTGAVSMSGAGEVEIQPADVSARGTYTTTRTLNAGEAGGFGVNVTVTVDKEP